MKKAAELERRFAKKDGAAADGAAAEGAASTDSDSDQDDEDKITETEEAGEMQLQLLFADACMCRCVTKTHMYLPCWLTCVFTQCWYRVQKCRTQLMAPAASHDGVMHDPSLQHCC